MPPFHYQLVFSVEGLINEYVETARILRKGKLTLIEPLTEPEEFHMAGFSPLVAFHTSGGTSTLPETFDRTALANALKKPCAIRDTSTCFVNSKELGLFSSEKMKVTAMSRSRPAPSCRNFSKESSPAKDPTSASCASKRTSP